MDATTIDPAHVPPQALIPLDEIGVLPWGRARVPAAPPVADAATVARLAERLETFAENLSTREQAALHALLRASTGIPAIETLAALPPESVLKEQELAVFESLRDEPPPTGGSLRPSLVLVMKATRLCNLRCTYCHFWRDGPNQIMSFPVLARAIRDALRAPGVRSVEFVWHGGEVTLLPPAFYRTALWLQQQFRRPDQKVQNSVQTNGTHLSDEWIEFLRRYDIGAGVSLDGPPEIHDRRRVDAAGRPTAERARAGLERLRAAGVDHGVLMVVDDDVVDLGAERLLRYMLELDVRSVALLNVIPENTPSGTPGEGTYLPWPRYVQFLRDLFQLWWPAHADRIVFRELADLTGKVAGRASQTCFFAGDCFGGYLTVEPNGDVAACDKYVGDDAFRFGNLLRINLADTGASARLAAIQAATAAQVDRTRACPWFSVCQGGCPHDRYVRERRIPGADETCCGLAPLLEDIAGRLGEGGVQPAIGACEDDALMRQGR